MTERDLMRKITQLEQRVKDLERRPYDDVARHAAPVGVPPYQVFAVKVTKDGGADGNKTTAPTWTYTVKSPDGGTVYGTTLQLARPRPKGKRAFGTTFGLAFFDDTGAFKLWDAGEVKGTGSC